MAVILWWWSWHNFFAKFDFVIVVANTVTGSESVHFVIATALMSVASMSHEEYLYILATKQRWKCT